MDKTTNREKKSEASKRSTASRITVIKDNSRKLFTFFSNNRGSITTCVLLLFIVGLLFGIASQLHGPETQTAPDGVTTIDYTTFSQQIETGNMVAVTIQGNKLNGLLRKPIAQTTTSEHVHTTSIDSGQMYDTWLHFISTENATLSGMPSSLDAAYFVYTRLPVAGDSQLMPLLLHNQVKVTILPAVLASPLVTFLVRFAPFLLLILAFIIMFRMSGNGSRLVQRMDERVSQIGKSRAKRFVRMKEVKPQTPTTRPNTKTTSATTAGNIQNAAIHSDTTPAVTFADVAGIDEVRAELEEIVQFLQNPERFKKLGAHIPRGALLVGPPGTGKTLLARAVAGEAGVPFFSMSASEFVEMFVGVGASRVRDLFNKARQTAPCVIFIDELDAVGRKRSIRASGNDERDQTLNQLLVELDGFDERQAVVVLAATNRVDILDKALLRPGRFDRRITVSLPDRVGREAILKVHTRNTPLHEDVELSRLARLTTGMSGADLANFVNEASLSAARLNLDSVPHECFEISLARIQLGALRPLVMSEKERRIIAYHEGGHALVAHYLPEADTVNRVTILPRGQSLGVTHFVAEEDRYNYSRQALMTKIAVALGGRVAEELTFGSDYITTGAENDLQVVTDLARRMVTRWGMSKEIGVVFADYHADSDPSLNMRRVASDDIPVPAHTLAAYPDGTLRLNAPTHQSQYYAFAQVATPSRTLTSTTMNALIDGEVRRILNEGRTMAHTILSEHSNQLCTLADALIEHEQLGRTQFESLLA